MHSFQRRRRPQQFGATDTLGQDIIGRKIRPFGNSVYDPRVLMPEGSVGAHDHRNDDVAMIQALGVHLNGSTLHVSASRWHLDGRIGRDTCVDFNLNVTDANQGERLGLGGLGRTGALRDRYRLECELLQRRVGHSRLGAIASLPAQHEKRLSLNACL
ncbi:MAG: DUF3034 family protein [Steroidobacteraceae bacterium]